MKTAIRVIASLLLSVLFLQKIVAQSTIQKEINSQVWKPFIESFSKNDQEGFKAVHSREVIRVIQDDDLIWGYEQYFPEKKAGSDTDKPPAKRSLELRFIQRIATTDKAFEVGYYKSSYTASDGTARNSYGKFHVVLRKENGFWKILVDADTGNGVTAGDFDKAVPME